MHPLRFLVVHRQRLLVEAFLGLADALPCRLQDLPRRRPSLLEVKATRVARLNGQQFTNGRRQRRRRHEFRLFA